MFSDCTVCFAFLFSVNMFNPEVTLCGEHAVFVLDFILLGFVSVSFGLTRFEKIGFMLINPLSKNHSTNMQITSSRSVTSP